MDRGVRARLVRLGSGLLLVGCNDSDPLASTGQISATAPPSVTSNPAISTSTGETTSGTPTTTDASSSGLVETDGTSSTGSTGLAVTTDLGDPSEVVIDFDGHSSGSYLSDVYDEWALFSTDGESVQGLAVFGWASQYGSSQPNVLCTFKSGVGCAEPLFVDFPRPAHGLGFAALNVVGGGEFVVRVFQGGVQTATVMVSVPAESHMTTPVDLALYPGVSRIEIEVGSAEALAFDDFLFTVYE
ncbi:hypothetical protein [Nannocystis sp. SCPEA4]|uniref:hypothetical protein n=1 Tax=Nannocystis sp. SCPEA4 TaxID=2996787 RepID=UPI00226EBD44|nr:hypothetical protein [Nannocystis sp. SCPEA4]MCY1062678.1 hypothetical protein [Nannocystis sp. SCPEA4]